MTNLDDDYVATLLKQEAADKSIRYSAFGLKAFHPDPRPSTKAPRPNTRFLRNIVKEADSHNSALLAKEAEESRERLRALQGKEKALGPKYEDQRRRERDRDRDREREGDMKRRRREDLYSRRRHHRDDEGRKRRRSRSRDLSPSRSASEESLRSSSKRRRRHRSSRDHDRDGERRDREIGGSSRRNRSGDRRHPDDHHDWERKRRKEPRDPPRDSDRTKDGENERAVERGREWDKEKDKSHRHHRHNRRPRRKSRSSSRSPSRSRSRSPSTTKSRPRSRHRSTSSTDPLEDIIGPPPPPPAPRPRGRGAVSTVGSSMIDKHFTPHYDPSLDVHPPSEEDSWDTALESYRDRQKWRQKGAERLRSAGFAEDFINAWENGTTKSEDNIKWAGKGKMREWDRGKVVEEGTGEIRLKPEWAGK